MVIVGVLCLHTKDLQRWWFVKVLSNLSFFVIVCDLEKQNLLLEVGLFFPLLVRIESLQNVETCWRLIMLFLPGEKD